MTAKHRILHLLPTLAQGGAELFVYRLTRRQLEADAESEFAPVVCAMLRSGPTGALLRAAGVPLELLCIERSSIRRPVRALRDWRRIYRGVLEIARRHEVDLIQTHLSDADWIGLMVGRKLALPVVLTFHSSKLLPPERSAKELRARLRSSLQARFYRRAEALVAVSRDVRDSLLEFPGVVPERVHLVPSAIEIPPQRGAEELAILRQRHAALLGRGPVLASVGRLVPSKGHDRLIRLLPRILAEFPETRLWIIGEGPERGALEAAAAALEVPGAVQLLGSRDDVPELLSLADVFVTGTRREGLGLAAAEGMAACLPVVAYQVSGIVDVVESGRTGYLVPDGDDAAFADAVRGLLRDADARRRMGAAARGAASRFDIAHSQAQTEAIHRSLLEPRAGGSAGPPGPPASGRAAC